MARLRTIPTDRWVLAAYAALLLWPFLWAAITWGPFFHSYALVATLLVVGVLCALVRRRRWAWWLLVALEVALLVSAPWQSVDWLGLGLAVGRLALLLSPPLRRYVAKPAAVELATGAW